MLIFTGIGVAWHVLNKMDSQEVPGTPALWMAAIAIAVKEALFISREWSADEAEAVYYWQTHGIIDQMLFLQWPRLWV
ncbi:MAG: hypothetical protein Ct9H300mP28_16720 [Pseudomonadota bacterium]|nr:MAG: hypothetical protein Ct9H300mP28_16720 [Pseudomonadota bacterium]